MSEISKDIFLKRFSKAVNEGYAAIFVGAGFSRPMGYVDWKTLLRPFAEELELDIEQETDLARLAQFYRNEKGSKSRINQEIIDQFSKNVKLNENVKIITRLPIYTYWTTNYDHLLEEGLKLNNRKADVKITQDQLSLQKRDRDALVYKMHGDVDFASEAVLTKEDYEVYNEKRSLYTTVLQGDLISKTFLFIGFSFEDPNLDNILSRTRNLLGENVGESYWLEKNVAEPNLQDIESEKEIEEIKEKYRIDKVKLSLKINELKRYGISTVLINDYDEITSILLEVEKRYLRTNVFISGSIKSYDEIWEENKVNNFCSILSEKLINNNYKVHSGFGLGVGSSVINGALKEIYSTKYRHVDEHLLLRPFPQVFENDEEKKLKWRQYREELISKVGVSIFIFGNKISKEGEVELSEGMFEEFEIAKKFNNLIIPVGSTGGMAKKIYDMVEQDIEEYPYLKNDLETLKSSHDIQELTDCILDILEKN
ncbi:SIR2 family protein [Enterococcus hirae]